MQRTFLRLLLHIYVMRLAGLHSHNCRQALFINVSPRLCPIIKSPCLLHMLDIRLGLRCTSIFLTVTSLTW